LSLPPLFTFGQLLDAPDGAAVLEKYLPDVLATAAAEVRPLLLASFLPVTAGLRDDPAARDAFWDEVREVLSAPPASEREALLRRTAPPAQGEPASATWSVEGQPSQWGLVEITLEGPDYGNPFVDVELSAEFRCGPRTWRVGGFYDGDGIYRRPPTRPSTACRGR
jgi:hypothetical protein